MKSLRVSEDFVPVGEFKAHAAQHLLAVKRLVKVNDFYHMRLSNAQRDQDCSQKVI